MTAASERGNREERLRQAAEMVWRVWSNNGHLGMDRDTAVGYAIEDLNEVLAEYRAALTTTERP